MTWPIYKSGFLVTLLIYYVGAQNLIFICRNAFQIDSRHILETSIKLLNFICFLLSVTSRHSSNDDILDFYGLPLNEFIYGKY